MRLGDRVAERPCCRLGHFDLTADLGIPGQFDDPRFEMMLERFAAAGATSNKPLAIMHGEPTLLQRCAARGFRVFGAGSDVQAFRRGLSYSLAMLDEISPTEV